MTMHLAGSKVPDHWFKDASLFEAFFGCDCFVHLSYNQRIIRRAGEGPCLVSFVPKSGVKQPVDIDPALPLLWIDQPLTTAPALME